MATRRTRTADAPEGAPPPLPADWRMMVPGAGGGNGVADPADDDLPSETPTDRVLTLLGSLDGDARSKVSVHRVIKETGVLSWCRDYTPAEFEQGGYDMIRREYGGGKFEIRVYGAHPHTGNFGLIARPVVSIEEIRAPLPGAAATGELAQILRSMHEQTQQTLATIAAALSTRSDPKAEMMQTFAMMREIRELFAPPPGPPQKDPTQLLSESLGLIGKLREASSEFDPPPTDPLTSMLGPITEVVKAFQQQRAAEPFPMIALPQGVMQAPAADRASPPTAQPMPEPGTGFEFLDRLSIEQRMKLMQTLPQALDALLALADTHKSPEEGGEFIADHLPDEMLDMLDEPRWFEMLLLVAAKVKPYEPWLRAAVAHAQKLLDEAEEGGGETMAAPGQIVPAPAPAPAVSFVMPQRMNPPPAADASEVVAADGKPVRAKQRRSGS